jgi:hypothetical protein
MEKTKCLNEQLKLSTNRQHGGRFPLTAIHFVMEISYETITVP